MSSLRSGRSGDRIPAGERDSLILKTFVASLKTIEAATRWNLSISSSGVKRPERDIDHHLHRVSGAVPHPVPYMPSGWGQGLYLSPFWQYLNVTTDNVCDVNMRWEKNACALCNVISSVGPVAQSVQRLTKGWTVRGSNPGGARFTAPVQTGPEAHPASYTMGTGSFPGVKYGRSLLLTPHPLLVLLSWKNRAIPRPTLLATTGPVMGKLYLFYLY